MKTGGFTNSRGEPDIVAGPFLSALQSPEMRSGNPCLAGQFRRRNAEGVSHELDGGSDHHLLPSAKQFQSNFGESSPMNPSARLPALRQRLGATGWLHDETRPIIGNLLAANPPELR